MDSDSSESENEQEEEEQESSDESVKLRPSGRSRRSSVGSHRPNTRTTRSIDEDGEDPSDFEPDEADDDSIEEHGSPSRSRKRKVQSYAELPSDYEDDHDFSSDEEASKRKKPTSLKRKRAGKLQFLPVKGFVS